MESEAPRLQKSRPIISPSLLHLSSLIGRQHEVTLIMDDYEIARDGSTRIILVTGELGIGKTHLLDEIALRAAQDKAIVLRGGATEAEGMPPYLPFVEALGQYIQLTSDDCLREQIAGTAPILASILPELTVRLGDLPLPYVVPPEQARLRLYDAIGAFLQAIGSSHVLVLLLDDLQWADTASLDLLAYMARRCRSAHLLVLGAYRESEVDQLSALARTLTELSRQRMLNRVAITSLSMEEIGLLACNTLGAPLSAQGCELLYTQSEGNPFFAEELLRCWIETNVLVYERGQWRIVAPLGRALPPSIVGALRQRFARLSPMVVDLLRIAAIIGRSFDVALLAAVLNLTDEHVEEGLNEAMRFHLIRADDEKGFLFSHDCIRRCLYDEVSASRQRRLHGIIGQLLERRSASEGVTSQLAELAFHFARSNDREKGIDYSLRAATQALLSFATEDALSHYHMALQLLPQHDTRRGDLLLSLGEVVLMVGKDAQAEQVYEEAYRWFVSGEQHEQLARAARGLGLAQWRQSKQAEARAAFVKALAVLDKCCCVEKVKVLTDISVLLTFYMGKQEEGCAYAQQALIIAQELGDTDLQARVRRIVASNHASLHAEDLATTVQCIEQMLSQAEANGDLNEAAECCLHLVVTSYWMAELRRSHEASTHHLALVERCRQPHHLRTAYTLQVLLFASQGLWTDAERAVTQAHLIVDTLPDPTPATFLRQFCGFLAYQREDYPAAECALQEAQLDQHFASSPANLMFYLGLLGLVQATMGKEVEARAHLMQVEMQLTLLPAGTLPTAPLLTCLALIAIALGDHQRAIQLYPALLAFRSQHYWFLVDRVLGEIALLRDEWDLATSHLAAAEVVARREGLRPELARILHKQACLALVRDEPDQLTKAIDLLNQASILYKELGISAALQQVYDQLHTLSLPLKRRQLPANLTRREAEVLKLVAQGKSNRQVARELGLTEKTVTNHLTHIFSKIGCENRVAATTFALRYGLA